MTKYFLFLMITSFFICSPSIAKNNFSFGYRLDYATSKLKASEIDSAFPEFNSGHTSAFFFRNFLSDSIFLEIGPGAWNSENATAQFTYQYNSLGLGYQTGDKFIFELGLSLGAGLMAITTGSKTIGEVQTSGTILRDEVSLGIAHIGFGYRFGDWTFLLDARQISFFNEKFSKLDGIAAGLSILTNL